VHTLRVLDNTPPVDNIIVVVSPHNCDKVKDEIIHKYEIVKVAHIVPGGRTRGESVYNGLQCVAAGDNFLLIHDGVRPLITSCLVERAIEAVQKTPAVVVAVPVKSTIKEIDADFFITCTLPRKKIWEVQTPQIFRKDVLIHAYQALGKEGFTYPDDASLVEQIGVKVKVVMGSYENIKVTTVEDLIVAEALLNKRKNLQNS
jgi:2-C-methyl-D-erythritol 4-phosphate cytidylyltransferase